MDEMEQKLKYVEHIERLEGLASHIYYKKELPDFADRLKHDFFNRTSFSLPTSDIQNQVS